MRMTGGGAMSISHISEYKTTKALVFGGSSEKIHTTRMTYDHHTSKLLSLLEMTWASPVFGDAYPFFNSNTQEQILHTTFKSISKMHTLLIQWLKPILKEWMHPISPEAINEIVRQIAPKSTAFCSAIAAYEIEDIDYLAQVGLSIALVYWIDHRMDRGDHAMAEAIHWWQNHASAMKKGRSIKQPEDPKVQACLLGLRALERSIRTFSRTEDAEVLIDHVMDEVLVREARAYELSRLYQHHHPSLFWDEYAEELATHSIRNVALVYVTASIYSVYRYLNPLLPDLKHILAHQEIMALMNSSAAAMIRVLDDLGDRQIDSGRHPEWGQFTLNLFNQPNPVWISAFLHTTGFRDTQIQESLGKAFLHDDWFSQKHIVDVFVDFVRSEFASLSPSEYAANKLFLDIGKRVIEAGYVNALGDVQLADY